MYDTEHYLALALVSSLTGFGVLPEIPMIAHRYRGKVWMPPYLVALSVMSLINCGYAFHFFWKAWAG
jgi:hypothetical protein